METYRKGQALRVSWVDSTQTNGWQYADAPPVNIEYVITQGFFINSDKHGMNLSCTLSEGGGILNYVSIPLCAIQNIQIIEDWGRDDRGEYD